MLKIIDPVSNINITKAMCPILRDFFKPPAFESPEFDKIEKFIK